MQLEATLQYCQPLAATAGHWWTASHKWPLFATTCHCGLRLLLPATDCWQTPASACLCPPLQTTNAQCSQRSATASQPLPLQVTDGRPWHDTSCHCCPQVATACHNLSLRATAATAGHTEETTANAPLPPTILSSVDVSKCCSWLSILQTTPIIQLSGTVCPCVS